MAFIWPTLPKKGNRQTHTRALGHIAQFGLCARHQPSGHLEFWVGDGKEVDYVTAEVPLLERVWYLVGVSYDPARGARRSIRKACSTGTIR